MPERGTWSITGEHLALIFKPRQIEVVLGMICCKTQREIANEMGVTRQTVKIYKRDFADSINNISPNENSRNDMVCFGITILEWQGGEIAEAINSLLPDKPREDFSAREMSILGLMGIGFPPKAIKERLKRKLTPVHVNRGIEDICSKLELNIFGVYAFAAREVKRAIESRGNPQNNA